MRQLFVHNVRMLPNDHDLMLLPLNDVRLLQSQIQQELSKLALVGFFYLIMSINGEDALNGCSRLNNRNVMSINRQHLLIQRLLIQRQ